MWHIFTDGSQKLILGDQLAKHQGARVVLKKEANQDHQATQDHQSKPSCAS